MEKTAEKAPKVEWIKWLSTFALMFLVNILLIGAIALWTLIHFDTAGQINPLLLVYFIIPTYPLALLPQSPGSHDLWSGYRYLYVFWVLFINPLLYSTIVYLVYRFIKLIRARYAR